MKHCLNKRDHYHAQSQINTQEEIPKKLQKVSRLTPSQFSLTSNEGRGTSIDWSYLKDPKTNPDL